MRGFLEGYHRPTLPYLEHALNSPLGPPCSATSWVGKRIASLGNGFVAMIILSCWVQVDSHALTKSVGKSGRVQDVTGIELT
jgi:hypothetical protein